MHAERFFDRRHAGRVLAQALLQHAHEKDLIVLGLPRGGVPVAYEVARALSAPLDVMVVRKLGVPGWEELAMGAIASGGIRVMNEEVVLASGVSPEVIEQVSAAQQKELERRELRYRGHARTPKISGKTVILVDDGIATGASIRAAIQAIRSQAPTELIVAVPVAAPETCAELRPMLDDLVALLTPDNFTAVGQWYDDFSQTSDEEVTELLRQAAEDLEGASDQTTTSRFR
jgi:putative phosphoribosyl transferase